MRLIDADVLKQHIDKLPALPDGNFAGNHSALKALINMQPTFEPSTNCSEIPNGSDDTISRQAAIDAFGLSEKTRKYGGDHSGYDTRMLYEIQDVLEGLPSAQPEVLACGNGELDAQSERWIPCSKRLPENRRYVLVTYQYEYGLIDHGITWYGEAEKKWDTSRNVIAWMPLPEPYKGDTDE